MSSLNRVWLIGHLGHNPEVRDIAGSPIANFSVATNESYKDKNGEKVTATEWHRVAAWGKLAETVQKYLKKGDLIFIEGRIVTRKWENKKGEKRYETEIICQQMRMLGGKPPAEEPATPEAAVVISDEDPPF